MSAYTRTPILSFDDLTEAQQASAQYGNGNAMQSGQYVPDPCDTTGVISLVSFLTVESGIWDGFHGVSVWSGYFIKVNRDQSEAVVAYRHW